MILFKGKIELLRQVRETIIQEEEEKKTKTRTINLQNSHQIEVERLSFSL